MSNELQNVLNEIKLEKDTNLLPENIKKDVKIFDIVGTLEEGGTSKDVPVKLFKTQEEMQADTNAKEGDLAVVYRSEVQNATVDSKFQTATFPDTVVLDNAITDYVEVSYRAVDSSKMFDCWGSLDRSRFMMDGWSDTGSIRIMYESSDGITYTRTDTTGNPVDFGTEIYCAYSEMWNDAIGKFIQVGGNTFDGLYQYKAFKNKNKIHVYNYSELTWDNSTKKLTGTGGEAIEFDIESTLNKITEYTETNFSDYRSGTYYDNPVYEYMLYYDNNCIVFPFATQNEGTPYKFLYNLNLLIDNTTWKAAGGIITTSTSCTYNLHEIRVNITTGEISYELLEEGFTNQGYEFLTRFNNYKFVGNINMDGTFNYEYQRNMLAILYYDIEDSTWYSASCIYGEKPGIDDIKYLLADTQFNLNKPDELLPGKIAYGKNGVVTGDGSIYSNLDPLQLNEKYFHYPKLNSEVYGLNNTTMFGSIPWEQRGEFKYIKRATNTDYDLNLVETNDIKTNEYIYNSDKSVYFSGKDVYSTETKTKLVTLDAVTYVIPDYTGTVVYFVKNISSDKNVYKVDLNDYETIQTIGNFTATGEYSYSVDYDIYKPIQMYGMTVENFIVCQITSCTSSSSSSGSIRKSIYVFDAKTETVKKIDSDTRSLTKQGQSYDTVNIIATNDIVFVEYGSYYGNMFNKFIKYTSGDSAASVITTTEGSNTKSLQNSMNILVDNYIYTFVNSGHNPTTCNKVNVDSFSKTALTVTVNGQEQSTPWYVYTLYLYGMGIVGSDAHGYHLIDDIEFSDTTINIVCRDLTIPFTKYLNSPTKQTLLKPDTKNIYTVDVTEDYVRMELMGEYRCILTQKFYKYSDASDFDYIISKMSTSEGNSPFIVGVNPQLLMDVAPISQTEYDTALNTVDEILGEEV